MRTRLFLIMLVGLVLANGCGLRSRTTMNPTEGFRRQSKEAIQEEKTSKQEKALTKAEEKAERAKKKALKKAEKKRKKALAKAEKQREKALERGEEYEIPAALLEPVIEVQDLETQASAELVEILQPELSDEEHPAGITQHVSSFAQDQTGDYRLQPGDQIKVNFPHVEGMDFSATLRPDGKITSPQFGDLLASGKTSDELSIEMTASYGKILKYPEAHVSVLTTTKQFFYVLGEVASPSRYEWENAVDLMQAISLAGGSKRSAELSNVVVVSILPSGAYTLQQFDLEGIFAGNGLAPYWLSPRDIVIIPSTTISNVNQWVDEYINSFMKPFDSFLRSRYYWFLAKDVIERTNN